jgi:ubiquinone/menaquinone biosynthesis C-methylase UbiE
MGRIYNATWGRMFAAVYDRGMKGTEEAGLGEIRRELLADASGRVLEIGAGTGINLEHYLDAVTDLTLTEPDPHMATRLRERLKRGEGRGTLIEAPAEALPFADDSFDTVVATLVLCTAPDPAAAVAEVRRVLAPGGKLLVLEHVRSRNPRLARWQDRWEKPWRFLGDGCHCNRDTAATLAASGFETSGLEHERLPKAPPIVRPLIHGSLTVGPDSRSKSGVEA